MKFIYNEIKDTTFKEVIPINSKQEVLIYEGRQYEDGVKTTPLPFIDITETNMVSNELKAVQDFLKARTLDSSPLSNLEYTIIKENMLEGAVSEMVFFLNEKLYWLAFRIERSIEYQPDSDKIPDDVTRELIFLVKEYTDISQVPPNTANGSIIYMKEYSYITI